MHPSCFAAAMKSGVAPFLRSCVDSSAILQQQPHDGFVAVTHCNALMYSDEKRRRSIFRSCVDSRAVHAE